MVNKKLTQSSRRKKTIKCECGVEIMLVPDVKAMRDAIEAHIVQHMQKVKGLEMAKEAERIEDSLIGQVFRIAIQSEEQKTQKE